MWKAGTSSLKGAIPQITPVYRKMSFSCEAQGREFTCLGSGHMSVDGKSRATVSVSVGMIYVRSAARHF